MKTRVLFSALCMIISIMLSGQSQRTELMEVQVTPPKFTGIEDVLKVQNDMESQSIAQYVADNFVFRTDNDYITEGTAVVEFIVTSDGELSTCYLINVFHTISMRKLSGF